MSADETPIIPKSEAQPKRRWTNPAVIAGVLIGLLTGLLIAFYGLDYLPGGYKTVLFALTVAFFLAIILGIIGILARNWLVRRAFKDAKDADNFLPEAERTTTLVVRGIVDQSLTGLPKDQREQAKHYAPKIVNYLLWARMRKWWLSILIGTLVALGGWQQRFY